MNEEEKTSDFDFDLWSKMAQEEPEVIEIAESGQEEDEPRSAQPSTSQEEIIDVQQIVEEAGEE